MNDKLAKVRKALTAGLGAGLGALTLARAGDLDVSGEEWITIVVTVLVVAAATWLVPNKPAAE